MTTVPFGQAEPSPRASPLLRESPSCQDLYNWSLHPPNAVVALPKRPFRCPRAPSLSAALRPRCCASRSGRMTPGVRG